MYPAFNKYWACTIKPRRAIKKSALKGSFPRENPASGHRSRFGFSCHFAFAEIDLGEWAILSQQEVVFGEHYRKGSDFGFTLTTAMSRSA